MQLDLSRFRATYIEESREGLDAMEAGLLAIESGHGEPDTLHMVFRAAHSIKGGAGTFGFATIAGLTHVLETLLDQARNGRRALDSVATGVLLMAVDVLRGVLDAAEHGTAEDTEAVAHARAALERLLAAEDAPAPAATAPAATVVGGGEWRIVFRPYPELFLSGNDPLRILRELAGLGELACTLDDSRLPRFTQLDPSQAWLGWELTLPGSVAREAIAEAFAWVEDQCELRIERAEPVPPPAGAAELATLTATDHDVARGGRRSSDHVGDASIRVAVSKVDALINLVGELVITQAMLQQRAAALDPAQHEALLAGLAQLERNTRHLQESVLGIRMLPVDFAFSRFPRMVRDVAARLGKQVRLKTSGEATELDKGVIEKIVDPLVHLVRNAIDHGLEPPEERRAAGKDPTGTVWLSAAHQGGHILLEVGDDGRGLDRERILRKAAERGLPLPPDSTDAQVFELVFHPGFSTAESVSDLSGRGVGMDVVKANITALGGSVEIRSERGRGTTVAIRLPLTLAILDGMTVRAGTETYVLPLASIVESLQPGPADIRTIGGRERWLRVRENYLPLRSLAGLMDAPQDEAAQPLAVVVESEGRQVALAVDALLGQQQIVVKNLETNYRRIPNVSGATILGDGRVALILDVPALCRDGNLAAAA